MTIKKIITESPVQKSLQFLNSVSQVDPNPIITIMPSGEVVFSNAKGEVLLEQWKKLYNGLPEHLLNEAGIAQLTNEVIQIEIQVGYQIFLFSLVWIPEFQHINMYGTDISKLKTIEQDKLNHTRFDALTQIANRQHFEEKLLEQIHKHQLTATELALILVDIDNFNLVNENFGPLMGNRLLKAAAKRIAHSIRPNDFMARLGGDEFVILVSNANDGLARIMGEKIMDVLSRTFQFGEQHMDITACVSVALYPETGTTSSSLLRNADIAMQQAKASGKNTCTIFSKSMLCVKDRRSEIIRNEIKLAADKNELFVEYQPQLNTRTQKIIGFEALLRWQHPELGTISPNEFFPVAEQTGCMQTLSQWLIERSLKDYSKVFSLLTDAKLSINISLSQLNDPRFLDSLCDNLLAYNIDRNQIILDVSENIIAPHYSQIVDDMKKIHALGLKICLDNFGSPQILFTKLLDLPIDYLKLDQQLLSDIEKNEKHRLLLEGIIHLANKLQVETIQKGIETEAQHRIVNSLGCKHAQGHYYCPPVKINELVHVIKQFQS
jgi:diguanylate cyclase (GGDEF)-like protein